MNQNFSKYNITSGKNLHGEITLSKPISNLDLKNKINEWVLKQGKIWPKELSEERLLENVILVFKPHWVLSGEASCSWSASIGVSKWRYVVCSSCNGKGGKWKGSGNDRYFSECWFCHGSGQEEYKYIEWGFQSGYSNVDINGRIFDNILNEYRIRCGEIDLKAEEKPVSINILEKLLIITPKTIGDENGSNISRMLLKNEVYENAHYMASSNGEVKNLNIANLQLINPNARLWLYPYFLSFFEYDNLIYFIEIDGITGNIFVEIPKSVKQKRFLRSCLIAICIIIFISIAVVFFWLLKIFLQSDLLISFFEIYFRMRDVLIFLLSKLFSAIYVLFDALKFIFNKLLNL